MSRTGAMDFVMSLLVRSFDVRRSRTELTMLSRFTWEAFSLLDTKELSTDKLLFSLASASSLVRLANRRISLSFCLSRNVASACDCSTSLCFSSRANLYYSMAFRICWFQSVSLCNYFASRFCYLSRYLPASFKAYSALMTWECDENQISWILFESSVFFYQCSLMVYCRLAIRMVFQRSCSSASPARSLHSWTCPSQRRAYSSTRVINSLCVNYSCFLRYSSSAPCRFSISSCLPFSLVNSSFCPAIRNFWSLMISQQRATLSLRAQAQRAFSRATLRWRSMLVLLKCMLISIREAQSLARSATDSLALPLRCSSATSYSDSWRRRVRARPYASARVSFYFSQKSSSCKDFWCSACRLSSLAKPILNFQFSYFKMAVSRCFDLAIRSSPSALASLRAYPNRSTSSDSMKTRSSSATSSLFSGSVLSSIFSLDRLSRQMVGPYDPRSFCLWRRPEVGERLMERLTEQVTMQSENALLVFM